MSTFIFLNASLQWKESGTLGAVADSRATVGKM